MAIAALPSVVLLLLLGNADLELCSLASLKKHSSKCLFTKAASEQPFNAILRPLFSQPSQSLMSAHLS
jgi:hypothetical protein